MPPHSRCFYVFKVCFPSFKVRLIICNCLTGLLFCKHELQNIVLHGVAGSGPALSNFVGVFGIPSPEMEGLGGSVEISLP